MYSWEDVAARTVQVYDRVAQQPSHGQGLPSELEDALHQQQLLQPPGGTGMQDGDGGLAAGAGRQGQTGGRQLRARKGTGHRTETCGAQAADGGQGGRQQRLAPALSAFQQRQLVARTLLARLCRYARCGTVAGPFFCLAVVWLHWWWCMLCWLRPAASLL